MNGKRFFRSGLYAFGSVLLLISIIINILEEDMPGILLGGIFAVFYLYMAAKYSLKEQ